MNAKLKAKQLIDKYLVYVEAYSSQGQIDNAKNCALILVNELIFHSDISNVEYWQDVKREIYFL